MMCPNCSSEVADDAAVCPSCDAVLDPSLLDAGPSDDLGGDTGEHQAPPPRRPVSSASRPGVKRPAAKPGAPKRPAAGGAKRQTAASRHGGQRMPEAPRPVARETAPKRDWREEVSKEDWAEMPQHDRPKFQADKALDPDDVMGDWKKFLYELSNADKLAFFGSATMFFACFFPWKETVREGEVLGLLSLGAIVMVLSAGALIAVTARVRKLLPKVNPLMLWVMQLGAVSFAALWCLVYMKLSWDSTMARSPIGNYEVHVSSPSFGVFLAFLASIVATVGTFFGLKETGK